ncbi:MAG: MATE family efflux transporter, partial [Raoultibacter sp.]
STALFILAAVCSAAIAVAGVCGALPVLTALGVPHEAVGMAAAYMAIVCGGSLFTFGYNASCSLMKGLGDAKAPFVFIGIASIINVVLDVVFVMGFGWGVAGAAWATVISQCFSCVFSTVHLVRKYSTARPSFRDRARLRESFAGVLEVGIPATIQMAVVNLSYLLVTSMLNAYGTDVAAASGVGLKISTFAGLSCWAIGQAITAMTGQNAGARKPLRMRSVVRVGLGVSIAVIVAIQVIIQIFAYDLAVWFGASGSTAIETTVLYLRITCSVNGICYAAMYCFDSFALGSGCPRLALINALLDAVVVRFGLAWLLGSVMGLGYVGVFASQALSPILPVIVGWLYYVRGSWRRSYGVELREAMRSEV